MLFPYFFHRYNWKIGEVKPLAPVRAQTARLPKGVASEGWVDGRKASVGVEGRVLTQEGAEKGVWSSQFEASDAGRVGGGENDSGSWR